MQGYTPQKPLRSHLNGISRNRVNMNESDELLTEQQEVYCQYRAKGYTKTKAAAEAYKTRYPGKMGWELEQQDKIKARIELLKLERRETFELDLDEQVRKFHDIYLEALSRGKLETAMKALDKINALGGFEVRKSEVTKVTKENSKEVLKDEDGDIERDLEKFKTILGAHGKRPTHQGPKGNQ
jgi:phage terminase small subunit